MTLRETPRIRVFGAGWCEDTARSRRLLRRLRVPFDDRDVDRDLPALREALALHPGPRRTPVVSVGATVLAVPSNRELVAALVRAGVLVQSAVAARRRDRNVGDLERLGRGLVALGTLAVLARQPALVRWPLSIGAGLLAFTALRGWCPLYDAYEVTSLDGPGDHPDEAERRAWLAPVAQPLAWSEP